MTKEEFIKNLTEQPFCKINDLTYQYIFEQITTLELHPGSIISESSLAADLDISRTPIRNALIQLEKEGLIMRSRGNRAKVSPLYTDEYLNLCAMRSAIECPAAYAAANYITEVDLQRLKRCLIVIRQEEENQVPISISADTEFHEIIIHASRNPFFVQAYQLYRAKMLRYRSYIYIFRPYRRSSSTIRANMHAAIYNALRLHFPDQAQAAVQNDIDSMRGLIYSDLTERFPTCDAK